MTDRDYPARLRARIETRDTQLRALGYRDYNHYLASPEWASRKAHYRKLVIETCSLCGSDERIQLHHLTYERVGQESMWDLVWLCLGCHNMVHDLERRGDLGLDFTGLANLRRAAEYAAEQREHRARSGAYPPDVSPAIRGVKRKRRRLEAEAHRKDRRPWVVGKRAKLT